MKIKNLTTTILGILMMIAGCVCFFTDLLINFDAMKFIVAELVGLILFRAWMSKDKALSVFEKFVK